MAVNSDSPAMRRAVGFDDARRESAERQIAKAWEKRIDELADGTAVTKRVAPHRDAETALRDTVVECAPSLVVVHTSEEGTLKRHLFTPATGC
ncbi:hypothetical protein HML84_03365 [Alcanivorax sp. IO_7]|nr:hypothetical protein HML84_03365 [Alcanivorax sp. IO_7]